MNHRFRKTALFAVFFLLRGGGHPIGRAGGNRRTEKRFRQNDKKPVWKIWLLLLVPAIELNGMGEDIEEILRLVNEILPPE